MLHLKEKEHKKHQVLLHFNVLLPKSKSINAIFQNARSLWEPGQWATKTKGSLRSPVTEVLALLGTCGQNQNQNKDLVSDDIQLNFDTFTVPSNSAELTMDINSGKNPLIFNIFFFTGKMPQEQIWTSFFGSSYKNVLPSGIIIIWSYMWDPRHEKIADRQFL